jgi:hypothetical protein
MHASGVHAFLLPLLLAATPQHWYFEALSADGKRALLRELDPRSRATFHVRVVDVDTGRDLDEVSLPELAQVPSTTLGGPATDIAHLEWMLASPSFARDIARGANVARGFPFGACGRLAAGRGIAFDAGDWLYLADDDGRVRGRVADEAAYDPRFSSDGKFLFFRKATGTEGPFATYEVFVAPSDGSAPPRVIPGTAGLRDRFYADGERAIAISSRVLGKSSETCAVSLGLKPPFAAKRLACLDEQLVESVVSPKGKWAAISTKKHTDDGSKRVLWRLRVVSLATGKVVRDEPEPPGLGVRAISDGGLLVQSGTLGAIVTDVMARTWRTLERHPDLGHRGFFRNERELVVLRDGAVSVVDVTKD